MSDPRTKNRPGLDEINFAIADQLDECELLRRAYNELSLAQRYKTGDGGQAFKAFYEEHLGPQIEHERERLQALIEERGRRLARFEPPAQPADPPKAPGT